MENKNILDDEKLEQARKINIDNDIKDDNHFGGEDDDSKQVPVKNAIGHWTDKQIAEHPMEYIRYLESKLANATNRQDLEEIKKLIEEISRIKQTYFPDTDYLEKGRSR